MENIEVLYRPLYKKSAGSKLGEEDETNVGAIVRMTSVQRRLVRGLVYTAPKHEEYHADDFPALATIDQAILMTSLVDWFNVIPTVE